MICLLLFYIIINKVFFKRRIEFFLSKIMKLETGILSKKVIFICFLFFSISNVYCANILISQGGSVSVNAGDNFYDAGGSGGNDDNNNYTITLMPSVIGEKVCIDFTFFNTYYNGTNLGDFVEVYDGIAPTATNQLAKITGDFNTSPASGGMRANAVGSNSAITNPGIFCAQNSAGALTIKFVNNYASTAPGFAAIIKTYKPLGSAGCNINLTGDFSTICNLQTVALTATGTITTAPLSNNFNGGTIGTGWSSTVTANFSNPACAATGFDGITQASTFLWMSNVNFPRSLASNALNVANGGTISFDYRQAIQAGATPCEGPDINFSGSTAEGIYLQYSTNGGTTWTTFNYLFPRDDNENGFGGYYPGTGRFVESWRNILVPIPPAAATANTLFRWHQELGTGPTYDNWGLDNIVVATPIPSTITITNLGTGAVLGTSATAPLTINVNPTVTTTYRATITDGVSSCFKDYTVTVNVGSPPTINYATAPFCNNTASPQAVTLTGGPGGTYTSSPAGLSINASTGAITPSLSAALTYTVTYTVAGGCSPATTNVTINQPTDPTFNIPNAICNGSVAPILPLVSTNGINGTWIPSVVSNTVSGTYVFTPTSGQCGKTKTISVSVANNNTPTYTKAKTDASCASPNSGTITITPISSGNTYNWVSGPIVSPIPAGNKPGGAIDERALINLPVGSYCVNIIGNTNSTITSTLFSDNFEAGTSNWALNNSTGNNIWIINNNYLGGNCRVGASNFLVPAVPNQPAPVTNFPQSTYLHVNATTTNPVVCGSGSSAPFPPLNANFNGSDGVADQKATLTKSIVTTGYTNIVFSCYWMGDGDANDYAILEYSTNGGGLWTQVGAKFNNQTTWVAGIRTDPSWNNQPDLRFRFRWINNNDGSSQDPPFCVDQISITGDQNISCQKTVQECFTILVPSAPTAPIVSITQPTCIVNTGTITITGVAGETYSFDGGAYSATLVYSGLAASSSHTITAKNAAGCVSSITNANINAALGAPSAPIVSITQPTCLVNTGTITITGVAGETYSFDGGAYSSTLVYSGLAASSSHTITAKNGAGCVSSITNANINAALGAPTAPIVSITQPTCLVNTGTITITGVAGETYSFDGGAYSSTLVYSGLAASSSHTITAKNGAGCISSITNANINAALGAPTAPIVSITQPT